VQARSIEAPVAYATPPSTVLNMAGEGKAGKNLQAILRQTPDPSNPAYLGFGGSAPTRRNSTKSCLTSAVYSRPVIVSR
jgi:hypothetical protein